MVETGATGIAGVSCSTGIVDTSGVRGATVEADCIDDRFNFVGVSDDLALVASRLF